MRQLKMTGDLPGRKVLEIGLDAQVLEDCGQSESCIRADLSETGTQCIMCRRDDQKLV